MSNEFPKMNSNIWVGPLIQFGMGSPLLGSSGLGVQVSRYSEDFQLRLSGSLGREAHSGCVGTGEYSTHSIDDWSYETEDQSCSVIGRDYYAAAGQAGLNFFTNSNYICGLGLGAELLKYSGNSTASEGSSLAGFAFANAALVAGKFVLGAQVSVGSMSEDGSGEKKASDAFWGMQLYLEF